MPDEVAQTVVAEFVERGYVDDQRLAQDVVAGVQRKPRSRSALQRELEQRGVDRDTAREATDTFDHDAERASAFQFAQKKAAAMAKLDYPVAYRRLCAALARRGFPTDIVHTVVSQTLADSDQGDDRTSATLDL